MSWRTLGKSRRHPGWIGGAAAALIVLHHDFWWWDDRTLVLGMLPVGLVYHAAFSIAAAALWLLACRYAWPDHLEEWAHRSANERLPDGPPSLDWARHPDREYRDQRQDGTGPGRAGEEGRP